MSGKATKGNTESKCKVSKIVTVACAAVAAIALVGQDDVDDGNEGRVMVCKVVIAASAAMAAHALVDRLFTLLSSSCSGSEFETPDDDDDDDVVSKVVSWKKPDFGWVKLNVDGSCDHRGLTYAGCGGVVRDASGTWLLGFAQKLDPNSYDVQETEMQAILTGLQLAGKMNNIEKLAVESDSETVVRMVENGVKPNHPQFHIIDGIRKLRSDPKWHVTVKYISEKANGVADRLAKNTRNLLSYDLQKYSFPPDDVCNRLLLKDAQGVSYS